MLKSVRVSGAIVFSLACLTGAACSSGSGSGSSSGNGGGGGRGGRGSGDVPVVTAKVTQKDIPVELSAIGNVEAADTISVRSQVTGVLQKVYFSEGDYVKEGDQLFEIDPRPYDAALKQADANLARDQALLNQSQAQLTRDAANAEYQQATADRQAQLATKGLVSADAMQQVRAASDTANGVIEADKASIESAKAQVESSRAADDNARVQLGYTVIRSPVNGRTGAVEVKAGNLVSAASQELMSIAQIQPIYITFAVPSIHLDEIKKYMTTGQLVVTAMPQDPTAKPVSGKLFFVDNGVDATTDTIKLKATFDNVDRSLWPGQFDRITLRLTTLNNATVVPTEAVQTGQEGQFVFVVKPDFTVEQRAVNTAEQTDTQTVIEKGLQVGETVVTEGQLRLEEGTKITIADGRDVGGPGRAGRGGRGRNGNAGSNGGGRGQ